MSSDFILSTAARRPSLPPRFFRHHTTSSRIYENKFQLEPACWILKSTKNVVWHEGVVLWTLCGHAQLCCCNTTTSVTEAAWFNLCSGRQLSQSSMHDTAHHHNRRKIQWAQNCITSSHYLGCRHVYEEVQWKLAPFQIQWSRPGRKRRSRLRSVGMSLGWRYPPLPSCLSVAIPTILCSLTTSHSWFAYTGTWRLASLSTCRSH